MSTNGETSDHLATHSAGATSFRDSDERTALLTLKEAHERHLVFDEVAQPSTAGAREQFEAFARAVRDALSRQWIHTDSTYARVDPKRIYYLSMEFLIGRALAGNVTNLRLARITKQAVEEQGLDWTELLEQEPDAGLGNGGLGRLAACFLDSMATMQLPAMGYGLRY